MKTCSVQLRSSAALILVLYCSTVLSQIDHEFTYVVGCFFNGSTELFMEFDAEELFYADFDNESIVFTVPAFFMVDPSQVYDKEHAYINAKKGKRACSALMTYFIVEEQYPEEFKEPPDSILYTFEEVQRGVENRLICFVTHFYPPPIKVSWTRNNQPVTEGVSTSRFYPNKDRIFYYFSTLKFTPSDGDIYSCTVEHVALEMPQTRTWEPDFSHQTLGVGLDIYCGVGLVVGLLGVGVGTFLIAKGLQENQLHVM